MKTMMIMAGGTGGHVMPALAVASELRRDNIKISWIGSRDGFESKLVANAGLPFDAIDIKGLRKSGLIRKLLMPFILFNAVFQTFCVIRKRKPDAVLGMGGFVAGPGGLVSALLRIPLILHEQNSVAGLTNRWLAKVSRAVYSGFPVSLGIKNPQWLGNPVRQEITDLPAPAQRLAGRGEPLRVLVVGGSQGAAVFNDHLPELLGSLGDFNVTVWHQTGIPDVGPVEQQYSKYSIEHRVVQFIDDMAAAYQWCDVLICRSGAMTVSEVCAAGVAAIFVPYPYAVSDHQAANANYLVGEKAAFMVRQNEFVDGQWLSILKRLSVDRSRIIEMAESARALARPDASKNLAQACMEAMNA